MAMDLTFDHKSFGRVNFVGTSLTPALGGYLWRISTVFELFQEQKPFTIPTLQVGLAIRGAEQPTFVGFAVPESVAPIRTYPTHQHQDHRTFCWLISPLQLEHLESGRQGRELTVVLTFRGTAENGVHQSSLFGELVIGIPPSKWVEQLSISKAASIVSLEIRLPVEGGNAGVKTACEFLLKARDRFLFGLYDETVACCRHALESLGSAMGDGESLNGFGRALFDRNARDRLAVRERIKALRATIYGVASAAHHPSTPEQHFTRSDAQLIVTTTAALIANAKQSDDREGALV